MLNKKELLEGPEYLLTGYQNEIFRQLSAYMEKHQMSQKELAEKLGVSNAYVSQILNGNFNFTLKKLIELGLLIGKVPNIEFMDQDEFWKRHMKVIPNHTGRVIEITKQKPKKSIKR